jgi:Lrp/AsnC family transcriptional regulator, leucine-responsive regulatory protein
VQSTTRTFRELDRVDRFILDALQRDGRLSIAELSRRVHLSATPCLARIRRLEGEGFIRGYVARLDNLKLGFDLVAFVEVSLDRTNPDFFERFHTAIHDLPEVVECHMVAGHFDYLLKVRVRSMAEYRRILSEKLGAIPGLHSTHTYFTLEEIKADGPLALVDKQSFRKARIKQKDRKQ